MPICPDDSNFVPLHPKMRRIAYICPIDYIRGSLSQSQNLEYNNSGNSAWYGTESSVSPDDYRPILVASVVEGCRYFRIKSRTTTALTPANRLSMAAFGAACGKFYACLSDEQTKSTMINIYKGSRDKRTFRDYYISALRTMFAQKTQSTAFAGGGVSLTIYNDFLTSPGAVGALPQRLITKFNSILGV